MMVDAKLIELFEFYVKDVDAKAGRHQRHRPERLPDSLYQQQFPGGTPRIHTLRHVAWMASEAIGFVKEAQKIEDLPLRPALETEIIDARYAARSKREKAHRWLGFIQGVLWMAGIYSLDELKEHSRRCSDEPEKAETKT